MTLKIKHLLARTGLSVIKVMGQPTGEAPVQQFYILGEALKSVDCAPFEDHHSSSKTANKLYGDSF